MNESSEKGILWLKLSVKSRNFLLEKFPPRFPNVYYDHVTLAYGVERARVGEYLNAAAEAEVYAYASSAIVEALRVKTYGLPDSYGVPHVTLSTANGVKPFESVSMLKEAHEEAGIIPVFAIEGYMYEPATSAASNS